MDNYIFPVIQALLVTHFTYRSYFGFQRKFSLTAIVLLLVVSYLFITAPNSPLAILFAVVQVFYLAYLYYLTKGV